MAQSASISSSVAERYAAALFELSVSEGKLDDIERDLDRFDGLLRGSDDLMRLVRSPVFSTKEQSRAVGAVLDKAKITGMVGNFVRVVAANRRLFVMPRMLAAFREKLAQHRGEVTAEVTVAHALTAVQQKQLQSALKDVVGKDVSIAETVDPTILGGLIVKIGSRQIDTSIRTKLSSLKLALKEVG